MKKNVLVLGLIVLMITLALPVAAFGATINVPAGSTLAQLNTAINTTAQDGDIVQLASGNYTLGARLTINKSITLLGAGAGLTTISFTADGARIALGTSGMSFTMDGVTLDGTNTANRGLWGSATTLNTVIVKNSEIKNFYASGIYLSDNGVNTATIQKFELDNVNIHDNGALGVYCGQAAVEATINNCILKDNGNSTTIATQKIAIQFFTATNEPMVVTVTNTEFINNSKGQPGVGGIDCAIRVSCYVTSTGTEPMLTVDNCKFEDNVAGVLVGGAAGSTTPAVVTNSTFIGNNNYDLRSFTVPLESSENYSGGGAPVVASDSTGTVTVVSFYTDADMNKLVTTPTPARINKVSVNDGSIGIDFDDPDYVLGTTYKVFHKVSGSSEAWVDDGTALRGILDTVDGLTNETTYDFKIVSSYDGRTADSRIVAAKPQAPSGTTTQPVPVVTQAQVDAGEVAPLTFVVPNSVIAGTTPAGDTVGPIIVTIPAENQVKVNNFTITAMTTIPAGVIAPAGTAAPTRFIEIKPTGAAGVPVTQTDEYTKVIVGYAATVAADLKNFALYYNHDRITYAVQKVANLGAGTGNFFWFDNADRTYTFNTKVYSTLMGVVSTNAATEAETNQPTIPTPASSTWAIIALVLVALGVAVVVGRKVTNK